MRSLLRCLLAVWVLAHGAAWAHKPSDSYLKLDVEGTTITGQWDIALRDLDFALGLDGNQDGAITWGEVRAKHAGIASYAFSRLTLGPASAPCVPVVVAQLIDNHSDGAYSVLQFTATCAAPRPVLEVGYRLFADVDPSHRGLLKLTAAGATSTAILAADATSRPLPLAAPSKPAQFAEYVKEGVLHIWTGFDHILFLLALLLPAVLARSRVPGEAWTAAPNFRAAFIDVAKIVTAFTLAHSITLSLAVLDVISLPSRLVESAIAASVLLAALNNVRPLVLGMRWAIAFLFGLVHGFGFASVLSGLGLPQDSLVLALVAFNVGVELGQLAIVAFFLPIAFAMRRSRFYQHFVMVGGSLVVALIAVLWLLERMFNLALLPAWGT